MTWTCSLVEHQEERRARTGDDEKECDDDGGDLPVALLREMSEGEQHDADEQTIVGSDDERLRQRNKSIDK